MGTGGAKANRDSGITGLVGGGGSGGSTSDSGTSGTGGGGGESAGAGGSSGGAGAGGATGTGGGGGNDAGQSDGGMSCTPGGACELADGASGIYDASCTCQGCASNDATGDTDCQSAYGPGYLCLAASAGGNTCVSATCRSNTGTPAPGCSGGQICNASNQCAGCAVASDCTSALGSGYVCDNGVCAAGECVTSADCHALGGAKDGQICNAAHSCVACAHDDDCGADIYYAQASIGDTLCDSGSHLCVSNTCSGPGPSSCAGSRLCCGTTCLGDTAFNGTNGAGKSCCSDSDCIGTGAPTCDGRVCSTCTTVGLNGATNTYDFVVDPSNTSDTGTSGASSPASCRFKTLTHALQYVSTFNGITPTTKARLLLWGDASAASGETFPLVVPANVEVVGQPQSGSTPPKVLVPAGKLGFRLSASNTRLSNLLIDGADNSNNTTRYSIAVAIVAAVGGSAPSGVILDHLTVQNSLRDGVVVGGANGNALTGGAATIGPGVHVTGAGFGADPSGNGGTVHSNGMTLLGTATVTVVGGSGADQTSFNANSQHGIAVRSRAAVSVNETLDLSDPTSMAYDGANVTANGNDAAGLAVLQSPVGAATNATDWANMPTNMVTGLVALNTTTGNGIRIEGGSKVTLRGSVAYGSSGDGVHVQTSTQLAGASTADVNFVGAIDLGTSGSAGHNLLQVPGLAQNATPPHGQKPNRGAGICLVIGAVASSGQSLAAQGNWLVAAGSNAETDCSSAPADTGVVRRDSCRSVQSTPTRLGIPTSVGVPGRVNGMNANAIDVTHCSGL